MPISVAAFRLSEQCLADPPPAMGPIEVHVDDVVLQAGRDTDVGSLLRGDPASTRLRLEVPA
jgi:hypothetical protein